MSEFILRGNKVMLDKPEKKEKESDLGIILTEEIEKEQEKELMKEWTHLNVFAIGTEVQDIKIGDKVYVRTQALHNAEIIEIDGKIKMMVIVHDIIMIWK